MISSKLLFLLRFSPFFGIVCLVLISSIPGNSINALEVKHLDKVIHFVAFSVLCMLYCLRHHFVKKNVLKITLLKSGIYSFMYGIFEETYQNFVPGRNSDIYDLFANTIGITFSLIIFYAIYHSKKRELRSIKDAT